MFKPVSNLDIPFTSIRPKLYERFLRVFSSVVLTPTQPAHWPPIVALIRTLLMPQSPRKEKTTRRFDRRYHTLGQRFWRECSFS